MNVALIHDWLDSYRGGEKVLEELMAMYPQAPIYTMFHDPKKLPHSFKKHKIYTPVIIGKLGRFRKILLPILPSVVESFKLDNYDLIISSSSCVAKGVITPKNSTHIAYIHSPMRYIWDQQKYYLGNLPQKPLIGRLITQILKKLQQWDQLSAKRANYLIANSSFVQQRIDQYWHRKSQVIFPPIDTEFFTYNNTLPKDRNYYLVAGAFVAYKRFDLAIEACIAAKRNLIVAGGGSELPHLKRLTANNPYIKFEIMPSKERLRHLMQNAKALLFAGVEDFGMIPIEAMSCGTPTIAYFAGGAKDYIIPSITGTIFENQNIDDIVTAIQKNETTNFMPQVLNKYAKDFSRQRFRHELASIINTMTKDKNETR